MKNKYLTYGVIFGSLMAVPLYALYVKVVLETSWSTAFTSASVLSLGVICLWMFIKIVQSLFH